MNGKTEVILVWGLALMTIRGFTSGDFPEIWALATKQSTNVANPGLFLRELGQLVLIGILVLGSEASDAWGTLALYFLAGLTLLFMVTSGGQLQQVLSVLSAGYSTGGGIHQ